MKSAHALPSGPNQLPPTGPDEAARYRALFHSLDDAVACCKVLLDERGRTVDHRFIEVNPAFEALAGLPAEALIGRAACEMLPTVGRGWADLCDSAWAAGTVVHFEQRGERPGHWYDVRAFGLGGDQVAFVLRDVSEQQRAHAALKASSVRHGELLESISDGFFVLDENLVTIYFNRAAERLLGRRREDVLGRPLFEAFPEAAGSIFEEKYMEALRTRAFLAFETRFEVEPYADWYDVRVYPREDGIAVFFQVITERMLAQEALRRSEERFRISQELSLDAFTLLESVRDDAGRVVDFRWAYVNPAAARILKHSPEELVGQRLLVVLPGNRTNSELFERYVRVVETGEPHDIEVAYRSEGIDGWFRNMCVRLGDGVAVSFSDITHRKRAEIQLSQLEEISAALSAALTPTEVMDVIIGRGLETVGAVAGSIVLLVEDGELLEVVHSIGYSAATLHSWKRFPSAAALSPLGRAVQTNEPVFLQDIAEFQQEFPHLAQNRDSIYGAWAALPLQVDDRVFGAFGLSFDRPRRFDSEERRFMLALAHHCAQALERSRLTERAQETAAILERQRLARDLHDAVSQVLFAATTIAEAIPRQAERNPSKAFERLEQVVLLNRAAMAEMRSLLFELRPEVIDKTPLPVLLGQLADAARGRRHIEVELSCPRDEVYLPPEVHNAFYRITQEGINNVLKHSRARRLSIRFTQESERAELVLADDGVGFDPGQSRGGLGLDNMRERAAGIGAVLAIESAPGAGTRIAVLWKPTTSQTS